MTDEEIVSVNTAARMLKISRGKAYKLARTGELPGIIRLGDEYKVSVPKLRRIVHGEPNEVAS